MKRDNIMTQKRRAKIAERFRSPRCTPSNIVSVYANKVLSNMRFHICAAFFIQGRAAIWHLVHSSFRPFFSRSLSDDIVSITWPDSEIPFFAEMAALGGKIGLGSENGSHD